MKYLISFIALSWASFASSVEIQSLECNLINPLGFSRLALNIDNQLVEQVTYSTLGIDRRPLKLTYVDNTLEVYGQEMSRVDLRPLNQDNPSTWSLVLYGRIGQASGQTLSGTYGQAITGNVFSGFASFAPWATATCRIETK